MMALFCHNSARQDPIVDRKPEKEMVMHMHKSVHN